MKYRAAYTPRTLLALLLSVLGLIILAAVMVAKAFAVEPPLRLPQKWVVEARIYDAITGEQISDTKYASDVEHPFARWQQCDEYLRDIGPVPAQNGQFIVFRCHQLDAQDEKDT